MNITRQTLSFCPTCYAEIPATIATNDGGVFMEKTCAIHGKFMSTLERDPIFYEWVKHLPGHGIYEGYFVDVTRKCNLRCETCFYPLEQSDPEGLFSIPSIVQDCRVNAFRAPFIFTGGDPSLHPEIARLITEVQKVGPVAMLTNGVKMADRSFFDEVMAPLTDADGRTGLNLSIHHKETDKWQQVVEYCRETKRQIASALIVVDDQKSFFGALALCEQMKDVVKAFRIKAATNLWDESKADKKVFVSDMLKWMEAVGPVIPVTQGIGNKSVFLNVGFNRMHIMLVSWNDVSNVDLLDICCAPWYRARNGEILNFVTASIVNEGISKGWLKGKPCQKQ